MFENTIRMSADRIRLSVDSLIVFVCRYYKGGMSSISSVTQEKKDKNCLGYIKKVLRFAAIIIKSK